MFSIGPSTVATVDGKVEFQLTSSARKELIKKSQIHPSTHSLRGMTN